MLGGDKKPAHCVRCYYGSLMLYTSRWRDHIVDANDFFEQPCVLLVQLLVGFLEASLHEQCAEVKRLRYLPYLSSVCITALRSFFFPRPSAPTSATSSHQADSGVHVHAGITTTRVRSSSSRQRLCHLGKCHDAFIKTPSPLHLPPSEAQYLACGCPR